MATNIKNTATGQVGYQVPGAAVPAGWTSTGGSSAVPTGPAAAPSTGQTGSGAVNAQGQIVGANGQVTGAANPKDVTPGAVPAPYAPDKPITLGSIFGPSSVASSTATPPITTNPPSTTPPNPQLSATGTTQSPDLTQKYNAIHQDLTSNSSTAPSSSGDGRQAVATAAQSYAANNPSPSAPYQPSPAFMATGDPILQSLIQQEQAQQLEVANKSRTVEEIKAQYGEQLGNISVDEMNVNNIMYGQRDDIANEISKAGGVATASQLDAIANTRNRDLIKQYNSLEVKKASLSNQMSAQVGLAAADLQYSQAKFDTATNTYQTYHAIQQNSIQNVNDMVTKIGYTGLAANTTPQERQQIEAAMGWPKGLLSNPPMTQSQVTQRIAMERLSLAGGSLSLPDGSVVTYNPVPAGSTGAPVGTVTSPGGSTTQVPLSTPSTLPPPPTFDGNKDGMASPDGNYTYSMKDQSWQPKASPETPVHGPTAVTQATGLSPIQFNYLTGVNAPKAAGVQKQLSRELEPFLNNLGIDLSTFRTKYSAYNDVLQNNIKRYNQTSIMEGEFDGTASTLKGLVTDADMKKLNAGNVAKIWGGQQVNDPLATQIAFQLTSLKNDYAGYLAAQRGEQPDQGDVKAAEQTILSGLNSKSIDGLTNAMKTSTEKNKQVLENTMLETNHSIWNLFGAGTKYTPFITVVDPKTGRTKSGQLSYDEIKQAQANGYQINGL